MYSSDNPEKKRKSMAEQCVEAYSETGEETDVLGSYTGIYRINPVLGGHSAIGIYPPYDVTLIAEDRANPVQDADDL